MKAICPYCQDEFTQKRRNQHYCSQSCRQGHYMQRKNGMGENFYPSSTQSVNNLSAKPLDGLLTDQVPNGKDKAPNPSGLKKRRRKCVRYFVVPDGFFSKKGNHLDAKDNPSLENEPTGNNDGLPTLYPSATPNNLDNSLVPIDQIPPQSGDENILEYMGRYRLTIPVLPEHFTRALFPHWTDKDHKTYLFLNEKLVSAFKEVLMTRERKITVDTLKKTRSSLHDLTDGIYSLFMPVDYPFIRLVGLVKYKLDKLIEKAKNVKVFTFDLPENLTKQMILVCSQAGQESSSCSSLQQ